MTKSLPVCALLFVLTLAFFMPVAARHKSLLLRLGLAKQQFLTSEPLFITVSLINNGDSAINVRRMYLPFGYFKIVVKSSRGRLFPLTYNGTMARDTTRPVRLEPHDSASIVLDLLPLYAKGEPASRKMHTKTFFSPGSYTVRSTFETGHGRTASRTVSFSVRDPDGTERLVHDLLVSAAGFELEKQKGPATAILDTIIRKYPESGYHIAAFLQKMYMYEYETAAKAQQIACDAALSLIDAHPASEAAIPALSYFMIHCDQIGKTRKDIREILVSIIGKYPDTPLEREAVRALQHYHADG